MTDDNVVDLLDRSPGRPLKIARAPSARRMQQVRETQAAIERHESSDPVVAAASGRDAYETLRQARLAAAREAAALGFERRQLPARDRRFRPLIARRVAILSEVARMTLEMHRLSAGEPSPDLICRVIEMFRQQIEEAAREVLPPEDAARAIGAWNRRLERHKGAPPVVNTWLTDAEAREPGSTE